MVAAIDISSQSQRSQSSGRPRRRRSGCSPRCAMIFVMVVIGGTRRGSPSPALDHGVAADQRRRCRRCPTPSGSRSSRLPTDPGVPAAQRRHDAGRVQGHLLVGVRPSAVGAADRRRLRGGLLALLLAPADPAVPRPAPRGHVRLSAACKARSAGSWCESGLQRADRCEPVSPRRAFPGRAGDLFATCTGLL